MRRLVFVCTALLAAGCGKRALLPTEPGGPVDQSATFTRVQNEIFTPSCARAGCHDAAGRQGEMVLSQGSAWAMVVGRPSTEMPSLSRVAPGAPDSSYLYRKVTGTNIAGERMPYGGPYLSAAQTDLIRNWILRGAPND